MAELIFFDLEVNPKSQKLFKLGAISLNDLSASPQPHYFQSPHAFFKFAQDARWFCGHNIFHHDLRYLEQHKTEHADSLSSGPLPIDTLYLSAWLFAEHPYHALVKDYHLVPSLPPDPVKDAALSFKVFQDCLKRFYALPRSKQALYHALWSQHELYRGFFDYLSVHGLVFDSTAELIPLIWENFEGRLCQQSPLLEYIKDPIALGLCLALIDTVKLHSIHPPWVLQHYPQITEMLWHLRGQPCDAQICNYCQNVLNPQKQLQRYFGYTHFREYQGQDLQYQAVASALRRESLMTIFPTGGGKSLTFQLPALIQGQAMRALTVVISPLVALMKDQVDNLKARGIEAVATLNGLQNQLERRDHMDAVSSGRASLLYVAPEALRSRGLLNLLKNRYIARFVIDEAHCFSTWGHDLRVDYFFLGPYLKQLQKLKRLSESIPVSCFTATAKRNVIEDIQAYFQKHLDQNLTLFSAEAQRDNLEFEVMRFEKDHDKFQALLKLLQFRPGPAIVFVSKTRTAEALAEKLRGPLGETVGCFHGKMETQIKMEMQESFIQGTLQVMVTTSAFGMGVDKEDVHRVIHYDIPESLEAYVQEAGRAGRNPNIQARCCLMYRESDLAVNFSLFRHSKLSKKELEQIWRAIRDESEKHFNRSARELAKDAGWLEDIDNASGRVKSALALLEERGFVERGLNWSNHILNYFTVRKVEDFNHLIDQSTLFSDSERILARRIFQALVTQSAYLKQQTQKQEQSESDFYDFEKLCDTLDISKEEAIRVINGLREMGVVDDLQKSHVTLKRGRAIETDSRLKLKHYQDCALAMLQCLDYSSYEVPVMLVDLKELNQAIHKQGYASDRSSLKALLNLWQKLGWIEAQRSKQRAWLYEIHFLLDWQELQHRLSAQFELATAITQALYDKIQPKMLTVDYVLTELKTQLPNPLQFAHLRLHQLDECLRQLHQLEVLRLESGLTMFYTRMDITRLKARNERVLKEDYDILDRHYLHKIQQINIMASFAQKLAESPIVAQAFMQDYFRMPFENFVKHYYPSKEARHRLQLPMTDSQYEKILKDLSEEQLKIFNDHRSKAILTAAGPGSGKTRVLVHKVASLLLKENVKTEQFLMLTFSRPAAFEIKKRLAQLIGPVAYYLDIHTFHGYAFRLLERKGEIDAAADIIEQATEALKNKALPGQGVKHKAVLMVDEYQDISAQEFAFLEAIIKGADQVRYLVVGDDDQNIYAFRGASVEYMQKFKDMYENSVEYYLMTNYRSKANLVQYTQAMLEKIQKRHKQGQKLKAAQSDLGRLQLHVYANPHLIGGLVENALEFVSPERSTAVLTHSNNQALLAQALLMQAGIPVHFVSAMAEFRLKNLLELRLFSYFLVERQPPERHIVVEEAWESAQTQVEVHCPQSQNLPLMYRVIEAFRASHPRTILVSDWLEYLDEIRIEDFQGVEQGVVFVSTMHKAKGKEFDQVFVLAEGLPAFKDEVWRQVYVACTRAKALLSIHTPPSPLSAIRIADMQVFEHPELRAAPDSLILACSLRDMYLGAFKARQAEVKKVVAGMPLNWRAQQQILHAPQAGLFLPFSKAFKRKLQTYMQQGYAFHSAHVNFIVVWQDAETQAMYRIPLPEVKLQLQLTSRPTH